MFECPEDVKIGRLRLTSNTLKQITLEKVFPSTCLQALIFKQTQVTHISKNKNKPKPINRYSSWVVHFCPVCLPHSDSFVADVLQGSGVRKAGV